MIKWFLSGCSQKWARSFSSWNSKICCILRVPMWIELITLPSRIDVAPQQLIFWEFSTRNSVIPDTTFIKIKESSSSASRNSVISATASLKIRERFRFSHKSVKIKLLNAWLCTRKNKSFERGIVINCFENIYCQMYIRLNTGVLLIRFNSIE